MSAPQILINGSLAQPETMHPKLLITRDLGTIEEDEEVAGLSELKKMTTRLRLSTRRPSIMQWRENLSNFQQNMALVRHSGLDSDESDEGCDDDVDGKSDDSEILTDDQERRKKVDDAIAWIRQELIAMKSQDHQLAMQLMKLRGEIQALKLEKTNDEHRELIEGARYSIVEESAELKSALFDLPMNNNFYPIAAGEDPLKGMGVTRMNLNSRRFSLR
ncbi:protein FAM167A-like [Lytechinus variegatus]|uniref:protein FAM167A-like n=1 Tax=Lytechinus variegatus TaxID=7654 RepID=UPI001BB12AE8|nr:protein FAM167A-like [Lytechinus variegatus]XP_041476148.1 protein FAM167A-like [Lytechinus variegatus]